MIVSKNQKCLAEEIVRSMLADPATGICAASDDHVVKMVASQTVHGEASLPTVAADLSAY
jgi:hypothetical protein